jgi:membrane fusion protein (multidrug efflux system)
VLATIVSTDPIYVTFPVSTRVILDVRKQAVQAGKPTEFVVRAQLPDGTTYAHPGKVNFLDIEADQTTDTITVRAEFANPEGLLVDGEFVNVRVERDQPEERLVVPQPALQLDQAGSYVLVVNSQDEVEQRRVQTGQAFGSNLVVQMGLQAGDRVIVEGIQKVRPGVKVQATVVQPPSSPPDLGPSATSGTEAGTAGASAAPADGAGAAGQPAPAAGAPAAPDGSGAASAAPTPPSSQ